MTQIELSYGAGTLTLDIPDRWLGQVVHPIDVKPTAETRTLIGQALDKPIGSPALSTLANRGQQVALIVDDYTRKTPVHLLLPHVLARLREAGLRRDEIQIVVALGTHRPMTDQELLAKVGDRVAARYEVINTPSTAAESMVYMGHSSNDIPAYVNRTVAHADLRIGLGMITPHMDTGFSGGAKIILPGVCSSRTVDAFHVESAFIPGNPLGDVNAPLRLSLERFVEERVPLHFIVNVVRTTDGPLYGCVSGDAVAAHRRGVEHARAVFGVPVGRRYPVVIANCYPYDIDWWQSHKGIYCGDLITEDGGTLIIVTAAPERNSTYPMVPRYAGQDPKQLKDAIREGAVQDPKQATAGIQLSRLRERIRLVLVSDGMTLEDATAMDIPYYRYPEAALTDTIRQLPPSRRQGSVAVIPQAGVALPLLA